jgi:hypothetical protein
MVHVEEKQHGIEILVLLLACCSNQFAAPGNSGRVVINIKTRRTTLVHSLKEENQYSPKCYLYTYSLRFDNSLSPFS